MKRAEIHDLMPKLAEMAKRYRITAIYAFGSRSLDLVALVEEGKEPTALEESDIDVGVLPIAGESLVPREKVELTLELEDLFHTGRIDLVVLPEADPFLAVNIIRGERLYCNNDDRADEYELYVLRRAGDLIPLEEERIRLILGERQ